MLLLILFLHCKGTNFMRDMQVSSVNELLTADRYFYAHTWIIFRPRVKDTFCVFSNQVCIKYQISVLF